MRALRKIVTVSAVSVLVVGASTLAFGAEENRIAGTDRYDTSLKIAQQYFPQPQTIMVATGKNFPDALAAGPYAAKEKAPILLVGDAPTAEQTAYIQQAKPKKIVILGGTGAVSAQTETALAPLASEGITRIDGENRFKTAENIGKAMGWGTELFVANGYDFPDALAGGAYAARLGQPLMLSGGEAVVTFPGKVTILGGPQAVPDSGVKANEVVRVAGATRFETAAMIADLKPAKTAFLASGLNFPDALSAVPAAAITDQPLLLARPECSPVVPKVPVTMLGGPTALGANAQQACPAPTAQPAPTPTAQPKPAPANGMYASCAEVWKALGRPIKKGEPGYSPKLDRDGDGIACQVDPSKPYVSYKK